MIMETNVVLKLIRNLGLDITEQNVVIDQDFNNIILYQGKKIKYTYTGKILSLDNNDIYFDPIENDELMKFLFNYFLYKISILDNKYFSAYYNVINDIQQMATELKGDYTIIRSDYYYRESLRYIDLIFKIEGDDNVNLHIYDF